MNQTIKTLKERDAINAKGKVVDYFAKTDNEQLKGVVVTPEQINRGSIPLFVENSFRYSTAAFSHLLIRLKDGTDVSEDFEVRSYDNLQVADEDIAKVLKNAGVTSTVPFTVVVPKGLDYLEYFNKYIFEGLDLYFSFDEGIHHLEGTDSHTSETKIGLVLGNAYEMKD